MLGNMKIGTRLSVLLAVLLTLLVVIGGLGLYNARYLDHRLEEVYSDNLIPIAEFGKMQDALMHGRQAATNAVMHPEKAEKYIAEIGSDNATVLKKISEYQSTELSDEDRVLLDKLVDAYKRYDADGLQPAVAMMKSGNVVELEAHIGVKMRALYYEVKNQLDGLIELQEKEAANSKDEADVMAERMLMISLISIGAGAIIGLILGISIIRGINRSVSEMSGVMSAMAASGDLTPRVQVFGRDEIAEAALAFNNLIVGFANILRQVNSNANTVSDSATHLSAASLQIAESSQAQSEAAAATAAAVEQITVSINSVAENTADVRKLSDQSLQQTRQGNQNVDEMIGEIRNVQESVNLIAASVKEFVDSTRAIAGMTQQVKDIAEQTNLLALNAAIEAARAGEQGRGFAVVADEVRKLAEKSAASANEIDQVTNSLNQKSGHVEDTVQAGMRSLQATQEHIERVSAVLNEASAAVTKSSNGVSDIASSVSEQSLASTEIARNVEKIAQMSEENHAAVQSNSQEVKRLDELAGELRLAVSKFRV